MFWRWSNGFDYDFPAMSEVRGGFFITLLSGRGHLRDLEMFTLSLYDL